MNIFIIRSRTIRVDFTQNIFNSSIEMKERNVDTRILRFNWSKPVLVTYHRSIVYVHSILIRIGLADRNQQLSVLRLPAIYEAPPMIYT